MGKFFFNSLLFGLFAIIFYVVILFVWGSIVPSNFKPNLNYKLGGYGHTYSRLKEVKEISNIDILFLGSSHAYRGFDTRIFKSAGYTAFNLGSSAQTPIQTKVLLKRYLDRVDPEWIIYEVYPSTFTTDGVESSIDIISNDKNDFNSIWMALKVKHLKTLNTLLYCIARDLVNANSTYQEPIKKGNDTYISGGYVEKKIKYFGHNDFPEKTWEINENQLVSFNEIVQMINERNIELILVNAPITPSLYKSYTNNPEFDHMISKHARYYNFNEIMHLDDSLHFYDSHHLNQSGVKAFNEKLLELLEQS